MKNFIPLLVVLLSMVLFGPFYANAADEQPSKTELIESKYKDGLYQYKLGCTTFYDDNLQPEDYIFVFCAQNDEYEVLKDIFTIKAGSATEIYNTLCMIADFSENFKEDGIVIPKDEFSLKNYKVPMFGWYTRIRTEEGYHDFKSKDFKNLIKKIESYCQKKGIIIEKN